MFAFASCDIEYFKQHAPALVGSALFHGVNLHVHVITGNLSDGMDVIRPVSDASSNMKKNIGSEASVNYSCGELSAHGFSMGLVNEMSPEQLRTYYACHRFCYAPTLMSMRGTSLLVIDVDCYFMQKVEEPDADVCLFLRDSLPGTVGWEAEGTRVAAGAVYYNKTTNGLVFAKTVRDNILHGEYRWFADQVALNKAYNQVKECAGFRHKSFDSNFMDWEFRECTSIWTGKGPRKYENPRYLKQKKVWEDLLWRMGQ